MIPSKTGDETIVTVEVAPNAVRVVEELTKEELADRYQLEQRVEKAFYQVGCALRSLRDRRLYRNTHKTFEDYCQGRFGFTRHAANFKIAASGVFENLVTKSHQNRPAELSEKLVTKSHQILPTKETQVRPLAKLEPDSQRQVWQEAVEAAGGKVPSERIVKGIVERLKERNTTPPHISYTQGDVVEIRAGSNSTLRKHNGCWGIIIHVGTFSCKVSTLR